MLNPEISCLENNIDPEQRASKRAADLDLFILHSTCIYSLKLFSFKLVKLESVVHKISFMILKRSPDKRVY